MKRNLWKLLLAVSVIVAGTGCKEKKEVTGVLLSPTTLSIAVDEEQSLAVSVLPSDAENKSVSWLSRNNDIATVNSGVVKGIAVGETYVVVATKEGNFRDSCLVTVTKGDPSGKKLLPTKITEIWNDDDDYPFTYNYVYDNQNRLTEIRQYEGTEFYMASIFKYNALGQVIEMEEDYGDGDSYRMSYTYNGKFITETSVEEDEIEYIYELDDKGQCIHIYYKEVASKNLSASFTYDSQGNCASADTFEDPYSFKMTYDDKNGIFSQINTPSWVSVLLIWWEAEDLLLSHRINNVVSRKGNFYESTFSYAYNEAGYPSKIVVNEDDDIDFLSSKRSVVAKKPIRRKTSAAKASSIISYTIEYTEVK